MGVALAGALAVACSSDPQAGGPIGPVYTFDGGADVATDHVPDAPPPPADHALTDVTADTSEAAPADVSAGDVSDAVAVADTSFTDATDAADAPSDTPPPPVDASLCPSGSGTIALVGGTSLVAFGATSSAGSAWTLASLPSTTVGAAPALVATSGGFLAVLPGASGGALASAFYQAPSGWSAPANVPAMTGSSAPATATGAPSLAAASGSANVVYAGSNFKFYHGSYSASVWGPASDAVGGTASQDYGPSAPAAAMAGGVLYVAYDGGNGGLYVDTWTAAVGWSGAKGVTGASVGSVPPSLVALASGAADLLLVFEAPTSNVVSFATHAAGSWSAPAVVDASALTTHAVSLAPLAGGGAVMVYEGTDGLPYASTYSGGVWSKPASPYPNSLPLVSAPTVASGACGVDAVAALVEPAGVEIVTLVGGAWSAPSLVNGTAQMVYATVATSP